MKQGARILGIDDASFEFEDEKTFLTGVVYRGTEFIEDIRTERVEVDGEEATDSIISLHSKCSNPGQIKAILLDGISFAGFNIVDLEKASREAGKPVIAVTPNRPDREEFRRTMKKTGNYDEKFEDLPDYREMELDEGIVFFQHAQCKPEEAKEIIRSSTIYGLTPEPIRVAHLIGRAL